MSRVSSSLERVAAEPKDGTPRDRSRNQMPKAGNIRPRVTLSRCRAFAEIGSLRVLQTVHQPSNPGKSVMPPENPGQPRQIAMIHTVTGLIPMFNDLTTAHLPGWQGFNMVDESLLRGTIRDGVLTQMTMWRLAQMVRSAVDAGAAAVVVTCSSLGPAVEAARPFCPVPLFRIDEGMARAAVTLGHRVAVLATLQTTLEPTTDLIRRCALDAGRDCVVTAELADGAFQKLGAGDIAGHDAMVADALRALAPKVDVIVLAQASMARALAQVKDMLDPLPVLTSPELGLRHIAGQLSA